MKMKIVVVIIGICSVIAVGNIIRDKMQYIIEDNMLEGTVSNIQFKAFKQGWEEYRSYDQGKLENVIASMMTEYGMTREIAEKSADPDCHDQFAYYTCTVDIHNKSKLQVFNVELKSLTKEIWFFPAALSEGWVTLEPGQQIQKRKVQFLVYVGDKSEAEVSTLLDSFQVAVTYARGDQYNRGSGMLQTLRD